MPDSHFRETLYHKGFHPCLIGGWNVILLQTLDCLPVFWASIFVTEFELINKSSFTGASESYLLAACGWFCDRKRSIYKQ